MISKVLRNMDSHAINERLVAEYWFSLGRNIEASLPSQDGLPVELFSDSGWQGIIDLYQWYYSFFPSECNLQRETWSDQQLIELISNCFKPLNMPYSEYESNKIIKVRRLGKISDMSKALLSIDTLQGRVWITKFSKLQPLMKRKIIPAELIYSISIAVQFLLGTSRLSINALAKMQVMDALLIASPENSILVNGVKVGCYLKRGQGMVLDKSAINELTQFKDDLSRKAKNNTTVDDLPISLDFVLQHNTVTIAELENFFSGQVFPCDINTHKNIIIQANGLPLARGELIWMDDRPAILIKSLEACNADK